MTAQSFLITLAIGVCIGFGGGFVEGRKRDTGRAFLLTAILFAVTAGVFCVNHRFHIWW